MATLTDYETEILGWRAARDAGLRAANSWLALDGLFWLQPGRNSFGAGPNHPVVLSRGPEYAGDLILEGGRVTLHAAGEGLVSANGEPARDLELQPDVSGAPTRLSVAGLDLIIIRREDHFGVRIWNNARPERLSFAGRQWYPVSEAYRVAARYTPHAAPQSVQLPDAAGLMQTTTLVGALEFTLQGQACRLEALDGGPDELFLIFRDLTSGDGTYPAGRYLYADLRPGEPVWLDFNKAYSPPCAFSAFATCPMPPPGNRLALRVAAGERYAPPADA